MEPHKGSREKRSSDQFRKSRPRKRHPMNPKTLERDEESFSTSAKKFKTQDEIHVTQDDSLEYRILNFITVFSALSTFVKCKECSGEVKFQSCSSRGLGFKIAVLCDKCSPKYIPSCSYIGHTYEINRRFIFVMRVLGLGLTGAKKFCGLMDMPSFLDTNTYNIILKNINLCANTIAEKIFKKAVTEEKEETCKEKNLEMTSELTVSGDGTWKKGVLTLCMEFRR